MVSINKDEISSLIADVGSEVRVYLPNITIDYQGDTKQNYLGQPTTEIALIRPRTDTTILNEQGLQYEGDALGYFQYTSVVKPEAEVWVQLNGQYTVYFVISVQPSYFENELKFVKGVLQKRRTEPITDHKE